jgi:beta-lactamase class A
LDDAIVSAAASRRALLAAGAGLVASCATAAPKGVSRTWRRWKPASGGRLGVFVLDTGSGRSYGHRAAERFTMCSTFKLPLAGLVFLAGARGEFDIDARRPIVDADRVPFAPVAGPLIGKGAMSLREMAAGHPDHQRQYLRQYPDARARRARSGHGAAARFGRRRKPGIDRYEPTHELRAARRGARHHNAPRDGRHDAAAIARRRAAGRPARDELIGWMIATKTGLKRLRAGLPADWRAGDKTGTGLADGMTDKINDIAIFWPPGRAPIIVTAYFDSARASQETQAADQAVLAEVGRIAAVNI